MVAPFLATRLMLVLVAWLAMSLLRHPVGPEVWKIGAEGVQAPVESHVSSDVQPLLNMWSRWDAGWYLSVARDGYAYTPGQFSNTAFYPLYPLCMRAVHLLLPTNTAGSWMFAGIVVSNIALLIALCYAFLLVRREHDEETASRVVLYLLTFPTALFFSAVYTESLFLALMVATFYYGRQGKWWLAGICGGAATLTRSPGVLLAVPLAIEYLSQKSWRLRKIRADVLAIVLIPLALVSYSAYLRLRFKNPMAVSDAQAVWGRKFTWQWDAVANFFNEPLVVHIGSHSIVDFAFVLVFLALAIATARRLSLSYSAYTIAALFFITAWGTFVSLPRYVLIMFPCFIVLGVLGKNVVFHRAYLTISSGLAAFFMILFALWEWVA